MISNEILLPRAELYAKSRGIAVVRQPILGRGSDGAVWRTNRDTAIKVVTRQDNFAKELTCYRRFKASATRRIGRFAVPLLEGFDEALLVIEMTIVYPPYLLDFGKVHLDSPPPYYGDKRLMRNVYAAWRDKFGKEWKVVASAMDSLRTKHGIYYFDPRRSNVCLCQDDVGCRRK